MSSSSRKATHGDVAARTPALRAAAAPPAVSRRTIRMRAPNSSSRSSEVPSLDPSSTTITSAAGAVCASAEATARATSSRRSWVAMTALIGITHRSLYRVPGPAATRSEPTDRSAPAPRTYHRWRARKAGRDAAGATCARGRDGRRRRRRLQQRRHAPRRASSRSPAATTCTSWSSTTPRPTTRSSQVADLRDHGRPRRPQRRLRGRLQHRHRRGRRRPTCCSSTRTRGRRPMRSTRSWPSSTADPGAGIVGPRILEGDGSLAFSLRRFPRVRSTWAQALFLHRVFPQRGVGRRAAARHRRLRASGHARVGLGRLHADPARRARAGRRPRRGLLPLLRGHRRSAPRSAQRGWDDPLRAARGRRTTPRAHSRRREELLGAAGPQPRALRAQAIAAASRRRRAPPASRSGMRDARADRRSTVRAWRAGISRRCVAASSFPDPDAPKAVR